MSPLSWSTGGFVHDERIGVRFGSAQLALKAWVAAVQRRDPQRARDHPDGSFEFLRPRWGRPPKRVVITIRPVLRQDATAVRVVVSGTGRLAWLQRRRCRAMLRRLRERARRMNRDIDSMDSSGPGGGLRAFSGGLLPHPVRVRADDARRRRY